MCRGEKAGMSCNILMVALVFLVVCSVGYYLSIINIGATGGFVINDLDNKLVDLKNSNQRLEVMNIELRAITRVEEAAGEMKMVRSQEVDYLNTVSGELAAR